MDNADKIGQTRPVQDPQDLLKQLQGEYQDPVQKMTDADKYPNMPAAPGPNPFSKISGQ